MILVKNLSHPGHDQSKKKKKNKLDLYSEPEGILLPVQEAFSIKLSGVKVQVS